MSTMPISRQIETSVDSRMLTATISISAPLRIGTSGGDQQVAQPVHRQMLLWIENGDGGILLEDGRADDLVSLPQRCAIEDGNLDPSGLIADAPLADRLGRLPARVRQLRQFRLRRA